MNLPISAVVPVTASANADAVESGLVFRPGSVVDARVLQVEANGLAKILISGAVIDALSEARLSVGANLRLAVSTSPEGVRLTIVPQDARPAPAPGVQAPAGTGTANAATEAGRARQAARLPEQPSPEVAARAALTQAVANAAGRQASLSPLFANLSAALAQSSLPPQVAQAALALLALRLPLDAKLSGDDVRQAAQRSGTFLEGRLAAGQSVGGSMPDLKAALLGLRQALAAAFGDAANGVRSAASQSSLPGKGAGVGSTRASAPQPVTTTAPVPTNSAVTAASSSTPPAGASSSVAMQPRASSVPTPTPAAAAGAGRSNALPTNEAAHAARPPSVGPIDGDMLLPVRIVAASATQTAPPSRAGLGALIALIAEAFDARPDTAAHRSAFTASGAPQPSVPPKEPPVPLPVRGQAPSAQPIAAPSLPDAGPEDIGRILIKDADGALARQVLLQAASLSDRPEGLAPRAESLPTRLQFEIPFATPEGTAMAHFEVAEDGGGTEAAGAGETGWQARFSLTTDAAGPVHALVTLAGGRTSVRMWAERGETAALLRSNDAGLAEQLSRVELVPGNISIAEGAPPRRRPAAAAGHFLDLAT